MNLAGLPTGLLQARIEHGCGKSKLARIVLMEVLTPASPSDLPPLGELMVDDLFWRYPAGFGRGGVPEVHVTGAADRLLGHLVATEPDPLSDGSVVMALARAGAQAMVTRAEIEEAIPQVSPHS